METVSSVSSVSTDRPVDTLSEGARGGAIESVERSHRLTRQPRFRCLSTPLSSSPSTVVAVAVVVVAAAVVFVHIRHTTAAAEQQIEFCFVVLPPPLFLTHSLLRTPSNHNHHSCVRSCNLHILFYDSRILASECLSSISAISIMVLPPNTNPRLMVLSISHGTHTKSSTVP